VTACAREWRSAARTTTRPPSQAPPAHQGDDGGAGGAGGGKGRATRTVASGSVSIDDHQAAACSSVGLTSTTWATTDARTTLGAAVMSTGNGRAATAGGMNARV
jgi:hypothetical protein